MATAATTYFANRARAAVVVAGGTPALADLFTVDRGFESNIAWETEELFGTDSLFRVDEGKHHVKPEVKLRGCKFYPDSGGTGGIMDMILNTLNGATGGTGTIADTNTCYLMDVYVYQTGTDTPATNLFCVKVSNAYLDGVSFPFPENDFIILDLTFKGRTAAITNAAVPTS
jgi:hypothetical protein